MPVRLSTLAPPTTGSLNLALNDDGTRVAYSNGHLHLFDERLRALIEPVRHTGAVLWRSGRLHLEAAPVADESAPDPRVGAPTGLAWSEHGFVETLGAWGKLRWHTDGAHREVPAAADHVVASPRGRRVASWNRDEVSLFVDADSKPLSLRHGVPRKPGESPQESIEHLAPTGACFTDEETLWLLWSAWNGAILERRDMRGDIVASLSLHERLASMGGRVGLHCVAGKLLVHCTGALLLLDASSGELVAELVLRSRALAASADGKRVAVVGHDQELSLFDLEASPWALRLRATLKQLGRMHAGRWGSRHATLHVVRQGPDERETWTADDVVGIKKGTAVIVEVEPRTGELLTSNQTRVASLGTVKLRGRIGEPSSAAFHPSESLVTTGAVVFDLEGREVATGNVAAAVAALPSGRLLTAGPQTALSEVSWAGALIEPLWSPAAGWVRWLVASEGSEAFVAVTFGAGDSKVFAFGAPEGPPLELPGQAGVPSPSGRHFATIGAHGTSVFDAAGKCLADSDRSVVWAEPAHALRFATEDVLLVPMGSGALRLWRWASVEWLDLFRSAGKDWCVIDERGRVEGSPAGLEVVVDGPAPTPGLLASWLASLGGGAAPGPKAKQKRAPRSDPSRRRPKA